VCIAVMFNNHFLIISFDSFCLPYYLLYCLAYFVPSFHFLIVSAFHGLFYSTSTVSLLHSNFIDLLCRCISFKNYFSNNKAEFIILKQVFSYLLLYQLLVMFEHSDTVLLHLLCLFAHTQKYIMICQRFLQVIAQTAAEARRSGLWRYADRSDVCERRGSGNNWACGYCTHGRRAADPTLEAVRRAVESCDRFTGFLTHMSLAGGTGSGLGSYLTRRLRDDYPHSFIVNQVFYYFDVFNNRCDSQIQQVSCLGSKIFL